MVERLECAPSKVIKSQNEGSSSGNLRHNNRNPTLDQNSQELELLVLLHNSLNLEDMSVIDVESHTFKEIVIILNQRRNCLLIRGEDTLLHIVPKIED